jgi:hypothetical protein
VWSGALATAAGVVFYRTLESDDPAKYAGSPLATIAKHWR